MPDVSFQHIASDGYGASDEDMETAKSARMKLMGINNTKDFGNMERLTFTIRNHEEKWNK